MDFKSLVEKYKEDIINSTIKLVNIESVFNEDSEYPFGREIDKALKETLNLCENLGFKTYYNKFYGYAEIGEGDELIGILGHLDVVPAGDLESWDYPPFDAKVVDGKIYGRGTQDDKGPTIAAIYAVKALLDSGVKFNKRVRFIFGTDEENLWRDMKEYVANEEIPNYGFTPDSTFPMINAEKGLLQFILKSEKGCKLNLKAGDAFNAVPDKAIYEGEKINELEKELNSLGYEYKKEEGKIVVLGKAAHASKPQVGINAIARLCIALNNIGIECNAIRFVKDIIGETYYGENIASGWEDVSGKLTLNIGKIEINNEKQLIGIDARIPVTYDKDEFVKRVSDISYKYGLEYQEYDYLKAIYVPEEHKLIKILRRVFEEETGLDSKPLSSGGATYARAMDNFVAFGAVFPGRPKTEHQANEYVVINDLIKAAKIYAKAVYELIK